MSKELEALEERIEKYLKAIDIMDEKGLSIVEISCIKASKSWEEYTQRMKEIKEIYFDDECVETILKTEEEYDLLKKWLLNN